MILRCCWPAFVASPVCSLLRRLVLTLVVCVLHIYINLACGLLKLQHMTINAVHAGPATCNLVAYSSTKVSSSHTVLHVVTAVVMATCTSMVLQAQLEGGEWVDLLGVGHPGIAEVKWCANRFTPFLCIAPHAAATAGKQDAEEFIEVLTT